MKKVISSKFGMFLAVYLILTAGVFLSFFIFYQAYKGQAKIINTEFDLIAGDRANIIVSGILKDIELLRSIGYFYASSKSVERDEFHDFTKGMLNKHPEIYEFRWLPKVLASERRAFEESALNEKLENFYIKELDKEDNIIKSADREQYFPIFYIEPYKEHDNILGLDAANIPERWNAMQKARDTGDVVMLTEIKTIGEPQFKFASRIYIPIYANDSSHETIEERRNSLVGFVAMLYNTETLVDILLKNMRGRGIDTYIYNEALPKGQKLICFDYSRARGKAISPIFGEDQLANIKCLAYKNFFQIADSKLTIICRPAPVFLKRHNTRDAWSILGLCLFVTIFLAMYLNGLTTRAARIEALVKSKTEELEKTQRKFQAIFDQAFQFIGLMTIDGTLIEANKTALALAGIKESDVIGKPFWEAPWWTHSKEMQDRLRAAIKTVSEGGFARFEATHPGPDGSIHYVDFSLKPLKDEEGNVILMIPEGRDITDRRQVEEKLKQANIEWMDTFNSISDFIFILDKEHTIMKVNSSFLSALKLEEKDVIGKKCYEVVHKLNAPWINCPHHKTILDKKSHTEEVEDPGIGLPLLVTTSPIFDEKGAFIGSIHIAKDISGMKKTENILKEAKKDLELKNEELKKLDKLKSNFVSVVSHELRTPLGPIKEGAKIILDGLTGEINTEQKDLLETVNRNADRLNRLINNVLDFQKLESGAMIFNFEENTLSEVIKEVYDTIKLVMNEKGLRFEMDVEQNIPNIYFDRDKIVQVLTNLLNNAFKFTAKGSVKIKARREANIIHVMVEDTGPGIKAEDIPKLFQTFSQLSLAGERKTGGSGLGLAISKEIILRHKGKIWVESEVGRGSCFQFVLPVEERRRG